MYVLFDIQRATIDARKRCNDGRIATELGNGFIRVTLFDKNDGDAVTPISEWMPVTSMVDYLNAMKATS